MANQAQNQQLALVPAEEEYKALQNISRTAAISNFYRGIGAEPQLLMIMLTARELNVPPMLALSNINIIQGRPEISARLMSMMVRRQGHSISVLESSDTRCVLRGKRLDNGDTCEVSFSIDEAQRAGLIKPNSGWSKYPSDMCYARALSRLCRRLFSDVIAGAYVEGEISQAIDHAPTQQHSISEYETQQVEIVTYTFESLVEEFPKEDHQMIREFLNKYQDHYKSKYKTLDDLISYFSINKEEFVEGFNKWKNKELKIKRMKQAEEEIRLANLKLQEKPTSMDEVAEQLTSDHST